MAKASTWISIATLVFVWLLISSASATTDASDDNDRELGKAQADIKALRLSEPLREKAVGELSEELAKAEEKLKLTESILESKNLEIKKSNYEKKASMAAQFAEKDPLQRVRTAQKDDGMPPIEEAELKLARQEIAKLQDDNKALDRLTKSKEAALLEAERTGASDDKDRELGEAQADIKALRLSEHLREKAVEENFEINKINDEKKASMAAQFAAEATLGRVHAAQKDDDMPPNEAILVPQEAELKLAQQEIAKLQDDNKALDRLTKSKKAALLEAERTGASDDNDRELGKAQADIKALRLSEPLREKLSEDLAEVEEKPKLTESTLESKNLEIKEINYEKKASMAAQFAEEAPLRRVHAAQKDVDKPPIEEAELKLARQEIAKLHDDNKALDRLTKSKEAALLEVERTDASDGALLTDNNIVSSQLEPQQEQEQLERIKEQNLKWSPTKDSESTPKFVRTGSHKSPSRPPGKKLHKMCSFSASQSEKPEILATPPHHIMDMPPFLKRSNSNKPTQLDYVSMSWLAPWKCYMYSLILHMIELVLEFVVNLRLKQNHAFDLLPLIFRVFVLVLSMVSGVLLYISPPQNYLIRRLQVGLTLYALIYSMVATALAAMGDTVYEPIESIAVYLSFASVLVHVMEGLSEWLSRRKEPHGHSHRE